MKTKNTLIIRHLRVAFILLFAGINVLTSFAQNSKGDSRTGQAVVIRIDGGQSGWAKGDYDSGQDNNTVVANENVSFTGTSEGIYMMISSGTNKIKLFALTGQLLFNGDLSQGHFLIRTRTGIYFLKINNKSYKVICK